MPKSIVVYTDRTPTPFVTIVMGTGYPKRIDNEIRQWSRDSFRAMVSTKIAELFNTAKMFVKFSDECQECGAIMRGECQLTGCVNPDCEKGSPSTEDVQRLMKLFPFAQDEKAGDYFDRLTAEWRKENK